MAIDKTKRKYTIKGGNTFLGSLFSYQERTGMSITEIMKLPYIVYIIGMIDAPSIDYDSKQNEDVNKPKSAEEEIAAFTLKF